MKQQAMKYWHSLKEQEQRLVMVAGGIFIIFILVMGIFRPLNEGVEKAKKDKLRQQELVAWVNASVGTLKSSASTKNTNRVNLSQLVNRTRGKYGISISKMQPSDGSLRVNIDTVEFNQLIAWIDELTNTHGLTVENLDIAQDDLPGFVRVSRLVLEK
ncbi:type II secretion system protein M [Pseudoalteromonas sp. MMG013]|uniref:type II secretion system protein GspM n=1 Tax=Pseudoalteromonas sp. MMG013 TaxID=2822687 RepID=UPI001B366EA4|nr:type II secretion system protein M [Pseudoalteromonas sp. MMG013]MBQ4862045.1 type II secretion system protein M [Pseudoalteromonas sp. MMG013]